MNNLDIVFLVRSVEGSIRFFVKDLGYILKSHSYHPPCCVLQKDKSNIELKEIKKVETASSTCMISVDNVDSIYDIWKVQYSELIGDFVVRDYKQKNLYMKDNHGNLLIIYQS